MSKAELSLARIASSATATTYNWQQLRAKQSRDENSIQISLLWVHLNNATQQMYLTRVDSEISHKKMHASIWKSDKTLASCVNPPTRMRIALQLAMITRLSQLVSSHDWGAKSRINLSIFGLPLAQGFHLLFPSLESKSICWLVSHFVGTQMGTSFGLPVSNVLLFASCVRLW